LYTLAQRSVLEGEGEAPRQKFDRRAANSRAARVPCLG
jgi:hypothetical protein